MSLYDKLLPWRSQRSGTSLARVCAGNALQMGEQLPYSRVRLVVGAPWSQKMFIVPGYEWAHCGFET